MVLGVAKAIVHHSIKDHKIYKYLKGRWCHNRKFTVLAQNTQNYIFAYNVFCLEGNTRELSVSIKRKNLLLFPLFTVCGNLHFFNRSSLLASFNSSASQIAWRRCVHFRLALILNSPSASAVLLLYRSTFLAATHAWDGGFPRNSMW